MKFSTACGLMVGFGCVLAFGRPVVRAIGLGRSAQQGATKTISLAGDMPLAMVAVGNRILVSTGGFHDQSLSVVDLATRKVVASVNLGKSWGGATVSPDRHYAYISCGGPVGKDLSSLAKDWGISAGAAEVLRAPMMRVRLGEGLNSLGSPEPVPVKELANRWVSAIAVAPDSRTLYLANFPDDSVYKVDSSTGEVKAMIRVGYRPSKLALSPDGRELAVASEGDRSVSFLSPADLQVVGKVSDVGDHPRDLAWTPDGSRVFVACAGGDTVVGIHAKSLRATEAIRVTPDLNAPRVGATPLALTMSRDGSRLYVADAGLNCVGVVDTSVPDHSRVLGFLPTGHYPSALVLAPDGRTLLVGNGKGDRSRSNLPSRAPEPQNQPDGTGRFDYVLDCLNGSISAISLPDADGLRLATAGVTRAIPGLVAQPASRETTDGLAALKKIHHVVYIIRENRTYDQVLGDIKKGDGDPALVLFGRNVTPNGHALAENGVLFDRFFCDGEVSEDGHEWCNSAFATAFKEVSTINTYSGRGEPESDDRVTSSPAGYLWDNCRRHGLTYKSYGEYASFRSNKDAPPTFTGVKGLEGHGSPEWSAVHGGLGTHDTVRAKVFLSDLASAEKSGDWPSFMVMHLFEDHTSGLRAKAYTPFANVGSNDLALGQIVEGVSKSRFWKDTAIFVIEDDAQDGPDHVDCHRSVALAISPYVRRGLVDHTRYTTSSVVRTMELILGLPPMTEFDARATPMARAFTSAGSFGPYVCLNPAVDLEARNPSKGVGAALSAQLDFSDVDRADAQKLNAILWMASRPGSPMPAIHRGFSAR